MVIVVVKVLRVFVVEYDITTTMSFRLIKRVVVFVFFDIEFCEYG